MNTVKIYLRPSGGAAFIDVRFNIFKGSYRNKLIDIYVPKSVLYTNQQNTFMNAVKIGAILTSDTGERVTTTGYYADYVADENVNGVDYAIYEMTMPTTFTNYVGTQTLVINVVNIDINNYIEDENVNAETVGTYYVREGEEGNYTYTRVELPRQFDVSETYYRQVPVTISVMTTQTCEITVLESACLDQDELVDPTELEIVNGRLNNVEQNIDDLQDELDLAEIDISNNADAIAQNTADIAEIKTSFSQGENYIGTITSTTAPLVGGVVPSGVKATLTQYVVDNLDRQPKIGDTIIYIYQISGGTDKNYKMIYGTDWSGYEIPPMELAGNGTSGLVQGTYNVGDTANTLVSIIGGKITNIYIKDANSAYKDIYTWINALQLQQDTTESDLSSLNNGLVNGTIIVKKAYQDENGNNIVNTYMTQNAGATKEYVKDYALPKVFNDVYYITADGYTEVVPEDVNPQFSVTTDSIGENQMFQLDRTTTARYELSSKNSSDTKIWLSADRNCDIILRLKTEAYVDEQWHTLRTELSNTISLTANEIQQVIFGSSFIDLGEVVLNIDEGDTIKQTLTIITEHSQETTFDLYSNDTYPSTFTLETQSVTQIFGTGELGEQRIYNAIGTLNNGVITFELTAGSQINENTEAEFKLVYNGTPVDTDEVMLALDGENYRIVTNNNLLTGNATVADLVGVQQYEQSGNYYWIFKGFIETQGADTIVRVFVADGDFVKTISIGGGSEITPDANGNVNIPLAGDAQITARTSEKLIDASALNFAVKSALTDTNHLTMTSAEQAVAQNVLGAEAVANKVTSLSNTSTDTEYPSAKCVYDAIAGAITTALNTPV